MLCSDFGFDPLGLLDPVNSGGFITPQWLQYSEVITTFPPFCSLAWVTQHRTWLWQLAAVAVDLQWHEQQRCIWADPAVMMLYGHQLELQWSLVKAASSAVTLSARQIPTTQDLSMAAV